MNASEIEFLTDLASTLETWGKFKGGSSDAMCAQMSAKAGRLRAMLQESQDCDGKQYTNDLRYSLPAVQGVAVKDDEPNLMTDETGRVWWHYQTTSERHLLQPDGRTLVKPGERYYMQCVDVAGVLYGFVPPAVRVETDGQDRIIAAGKGVA